MSGPNRTVAAARNARWALVEEKIFNYYAEARVTAIEMRLAHPGDRIRLTSFRFGPRKENGRHYAVRRYET